jgi:drug/metabolite transporter (DMT)-like permease
MVRPAINWLNIGVGFVGVSYLLAFGRYFGLSVGRDHLGDAFISFLGFAASIVPALGSVFGLRMPDKPLTGWRVPALVLCGLLMPTLLLLYSYED